MVSERRENLTQNPHPRVMADLGTQKPFRILHVAESVMGGVGTYLAELAPRQIARWGEGRVRLIVPCEHKRQVSPVPEECLITFARPDRSPASLFRLLAALRGEIRAFQPDIIHAHSTFAGLIVRVFLGWRKNRPKIVYCPHGWSFDRHAPWPATQLFRFAEARMAALCNKIVAVSVSEAKLAREIGINPERLATVLNGIERDGPEAPPLAWDESRLRVLFVGRLDQQKGFDVLLSAVAGLEDRISVRVAGERVASADDASGPLPASVELLGWLSPEQLSSTLQTADVVVIPSRWEAFGLVALEAMRAGKMVIASRVGGLPEVIEDGITGYLIPPEDPEALRQALLQAIPARVAQMGQRGRERFLAMFTIDRTDELLDALYADLMSDAPGACERPVFTIRHSGAPTREEALQRSEVDERL